MDTKTALYQDVTRITEDYFGPATSRFIDRLIMNHLDKQPEELAYGDMPELIEWIRLTASMLTEDKDSVQELAQRLEVLKS